MQAPSENPSAGGKKGGKSKSPPISKDKGTDGKSEAVTKKVYSFLLAASFFDCSEATAPKDEAPSGKKKKKKVSIDY